MMIKILVWVLNRVFNSQKRSMIEPCIKELYRRMAVEDLKIKQEIVKVKKGKRRYDVIYFETPQGKIKLNLGRHWEDENANKSFELIKNTANEMVFSEV